MPTPTEDYLVAKRSLGFFPISMEDIRRNQTNMNSQNTPREHFVHAGEAVIKNFLSHELKMPEKEIDKLRFHDVFYPQAGSDAKILFTEFEEERDVKSVMRYAQNMKGTQQEDPKITRFVPKSLRPQYQLLQTMAYDARKATPKMNTKIWFADTLELRVRALGDNTLWAQIIPINQSTIPHKSQQPRNSHHNLPINNLPSNNLPISSRTDQAEQMDHSSNTTTSTPPTKSFPPIRGFANLSDNCQD